MYLVVLKAIHKREREILEEKRKAEKTLERQKKKEKKQEEKDRKKLIMVRQRSFSLDDGLSKEAEEPQTPLELSGGVSSPVASTMIVGEPKKYHAKKRLSVVLDAFSRKDLDKLEHKRNEAHGRQPGRIPKSQSIYEQGDLWINFINGPGGADVPVTREGE